MTWELWIAFVTGAITPVAVEILRTQVERRQRRQERRDDFQRETLLGLQESIYWLAEAMELAIADYRLESAGQSPRWRSGTTDWTLTSRNAIARMVFLAARTEDDQLRTLVQQYRDALRELTQTAKTAEDAEAGIKKVWEFQKKANDRIGELLRSI